MTFEETIRQVAKQHHTTPEVVLKEIEQAMEQAQKHTDSRVQTRWASIPHKGDKITAEEFISYIAAVVLSRL